MDKPYLSSQQQTDIEKELIYTLTDYLNEIDRTDLKLTLETGITPALHRNYIYISLWTGEEENDLA